MNVCMNTCLNVLRNTKQIFIKFRRNKFILQTPEER